MQDLIRSPRKRDFAADAFVGASSLHQAGAVLRGRLKMGSEPVRRSSWNALTEIVTNHHQNSISFARLLESFRGLFMVRSALA